MIKFNIGFAGTSDIVIPFFESFIKDDRFNLKLILTKDNSNVSRKNRYCLKDFLDKNPSILNNVDLYLPNKMKETDESIFNELDAMIVISYGHKIPNRMLVKCPWINMHASLLPKWRGASPINSAIIAGETTTGLTSTIMEERIDSGPIIDQIELPIYYNDNAKSLSDRMQDIGPKWFCKSVYMFLRGEITPTPQDDNLATFAPIILNSDKIINWEDSAHNLYNKIRGMSPDPCCKICIDGIHMKIISSEVINTDDSEMPGTLIEDPNKIVIKCGQDSLRLTKIVPSSGKLMSDSEFCRGKHITKKSVIS